MLATIPLIMPPFVGALAFLTLLNPTSGVINLLLRPLVGGQYGPIDIYWHLRAEWSLLGLRLPVYVHPGIVLIQTLRLYPLIYLSVSSALSNIDPSLEESAMNMGARGWGLFKTVTFPLVLPGYAAGLILVLIWTISDLGTPLILGFYNYLPFTAWRMLPGGGAIGVAPVLGQIISVLLLAASMACLLAVRGYVSLRRYAVVGVARVAARRIGGRRAAGVLAFSLGVVALSLLPHIGIFYGAFVGPDGTPTLENLAYVASRDLHYFQNTLGYVSVATLLNVLLGVSLAYLLQGKSFPGRDALDVLSTLPFAIPGVVIGSAYYAMFTGRTLPFSNVPVLQLGAPLVLAYLFRRLPYTVRTSYAALQQIHPDLEAAAMSLGAERLRTALTVTLPLMARSIFAGTILALVNTITELSSTMFLYPPGSPTVTVGIVLVSQKGDWGEASALGALLIAMVGIGLYLANRVVGRRFGAAFGA